VSREHDRRIVGVRAIQQHHVAEHLRDLRSRPRGELIGSVLAIDPGVLAEPDLDELVIDQRPIDGGYDSIVDAALSDLDEWMQLVTERAKVTALLAGQHVRRLYR